MKKAKPVHGADLVLKARNIAGDVRIQYNDQPDFERIANAFGIFEEWKVIFVVNCSLSLNIMEIKRKVYLILQFLLYHGEYQIIFSSINYTSSSRNKNNIRT